MAVLEVWDARGCSFCSLEGAELVIGHAGDCHLVLGNDDAVSRRHAAVTLVGGVWIIHDLGSRNGTWVNGARINGQRALHHTDTVNIGRARASCFATAAARPSARRRHPSPSLLRSRRRSTERWWSSSVRSWSPTSRSPDRPP